MESRTEHTGLFAAGWGETGEERGDRIRPVAGMWTGEAAGRRGKSEGSCVSELRGLRELLTTAGPARQVAELPLAPAPVIPAHLRLAAARKIAELKGSPILLVEGDGALAGILDEHKLLATADDVQAGDAMRPLDVCLAATTSLARARELFLRTGSAALPVAAGAFLLGVVTRAAIDGALRDLERQDADDRDAPVPRRKAA
jgi:CBS domain-containing protein